ncbi:MAG: hypothetical protein AB7I38_07265 [Dehalococcoidia bacterium]
MGLLADFRSAAVARLQLPDDQRLSPASLFALVRDMPLTADDAGIGPAIEDWRASQATKHILLYQLYRDFGLDCVLIYAAQEVTPSLRPWLPSELIDETVSDPIPDVHAFLRLNIGAEWMAIDATWPARTASHGVPTNDRFEPGRDMTLACDPDELFHVPDSTDPTEFYELLVSRIVGDAAERRRSFLRRLDAWLGGETAD